MNNRKTAAELMAELQSDSAFLARRLASEKERKDLESELSKAEEPLIFALQKVGVDVQSVWNLIGRQEGCNQVIDVLIQHVKLNYPDRVREGILRALATPDAIGHWGELMTFFERNSLSLSPELRYLTAVALNGAANDSVIDDVIRLVNDVRYGFDRMPLLYALQRSENAKAKMALHALRKDPFVGKEVKRLRRQKRLQTKRVE